MRFALNIAAGIAALTVGAASAYAAPSSTGTIDQYSFAGGRDAVVIAPLQTGRSAVRDQVGPRAFSQSDFSHAFTLLSGAE